jgi:hypothetical protein
MKRPPNHRLHHEQSHRRRRTRTPASLCFGSFRPVAIRYSDTEPRRPPTRRVPCLLRRASARLARRTNLPAVSDHERRILQQIEWPLNWLLRVTICSDCTVPLPIMALCAQCCGGQFHHGQCGTCVPGQPDPSMWRLCATLIACYSGLHMLRPSQFERVAQRMLAVPYLA